MSNTKQVAEEEPAESIIFNPLQTRMVLFFYRVSFSPEYSSAFMLQARMWRNAFYGPAAAYGMPRRSKLISKLK
jgi:hypothetical protein